MKKGLIIADKIGIGALNGTFDIIGRPFGIAVKLDGDVLACHLFHVKSKCVGCHGSNKEVWERYVWDLGFILGTCITSIFS